MFTKKCENDSCSNILTYKRANALSRAIRQKTYCPTCFSNNKKKEVLEVYISYCKQCNKEKQHKTRNALNQANYKGSLCRECGAKDKKAEKQDNKVICPICKEERELSSAKLARRALLNNNGECLSCSINSSETHISKINKLNKKPKEYHLNKKRLYNKNIDKLKIKQYKMTYRSIEKNIEHELEYSKQYRIKNKEILKEKSKEYNKTQMGRLRSYKNGAKQRNISFNLTEDEFFSFWQKPCYYCNSEIETIGIDRKDSSIGYIFNNCVPCCIICNMMKKTYKEEEWLEQMINILINKGYKIS